MWAVDEARGELLGARARTVGKIDIDDELALHWLEDLELLVVARRGREDGTDIDLVRQLGDQVLLEGGRVLIAQVTNVDVVARRERELTPMEQVSAGLLLVLCIVAEPAAHEVDREDPVVVPAWASEQVLGY